MPIKKTGLVAQARKLSHEKSRRAPPVQRDSEAADAIVAKSKEKARLRLRKVKATK